MDSMADIPARRIARKMILEALARRKAVRLAFEGNSMNPLLEAGDVILVGAPSRFPRPGDVVLYLSGGVFVAHRVIRRRRAGEAASVQVKGDFTPGGLENLPVGRVLGVVLSRQRGGHTLDLRSRRMLTLGRVIARLSPWAVRLGMSLPRPLRRGIKRNALKAFRRGIS